MVINKTVKINTADVTTTLAMPYSVRYKKVRGPNEGYMQNGDYMPDVRTTKAVVTFRPQPQTLAQASALAVACKAATVQLYYFDVAEGGYATITAMPSEPEFSYAGQASDGTDRFTVSNLSFEEQ